MGAKATGTPAPAPQPWRAAAAEPAVRARTGARGWLTAGSRPWVRVLFGPGRPQIGGSVVATPGPHLGCQEPVRGSQGFASWPVVNPGPGGARPPHTPSPGVSLMPTQVPLACCSDLSRSPVKQPTKVHCLDRQLESGSASVYRRPKSQLPQSQRLRSQVPSQGTGGPPRSRAPEPSPRLRGGLGSTALGPSLSRPECPHPRKSSEPWRHRAPGPAAHRCALSPRLSFPGAGGDEVTARLAASRFCGSRHTRSLPRLPVVRMDHSPFIRRPAQHPGLPRLGPLRPAPRREPLPFSWANPQEWGCGACTPRLSTAGFGSARPAPDRERPQGRTCRCRLALRPEPGTAPRPGRSHRYLSPDCMSCRL